MSLKDFTEEEIRQFAADSGSMRELCRKLKYHTNGDTDKVIKKYLSEHNISIDHFTGRAKNAVKRSVENVFVENSTACQTVLRKGYIKGNYSEYKCAICGQEPEWQGKPLVLTLDHINGKNHDDRLENLRGVCPNCDRQLETYGSRNRVAKNQEIQYDFTPAVKETKIITAVDITNNPVKIKVSKRKQKEILKDILPDRQELKDLIWANKNYTIVAAHYDVSPATLRRWCDKLNLPKSIATVKNTTEEGWESENWNDKPPFVPQLTPPKPVNQIDIDTGEIIAIFGSLTDAGKSLKSDKRKGKQAATHISNCCNGTRQTAYGYMWSGVNQDNIN